MYKGRWVSWNIIALLSTVVALLSYRYFLPLNFLEAAMGPLYSRYFAYPNFIPDIVATNRYLSPWIIPHAAGGGTALLIGSLQFIPALRSRVPIMHRWVGRIYILSCMIGAISGFILAFGASTGLVSTVGFGVSGLLWIYVTGMAFNLALRRRFDEHREWMIRSMALTFGAVTLRLYISFMIPTLFLLSKDSYTALLLFEDAYPALSFVSWVPNLIIAELYIRRTRLPNPRLNYSG